MARSVNFDLSHPLMEDGLESPADEDGVQDSFSQLIAEQCRNQEPSDAIELQYLQRDLEKEGGDHMGYLTIPEDGVLRLGGGGPEEDDNDDEREMDLLIQERWSSATMRILSSMPSRTIGRSRGAIISQYYNKTMRLRRRTQSRQTIRDWSRSARPSIRDYGIEADTTDSAETKQQRLVNNLRNLSVGDRVRMLRAMPLNLAEKRKLRSLTLKEGKRIRSRSTLPCCSSLRFHIINAFRHAWYSWLSFLHSLSLWQTHLKRVSGRFGSGVLSYFLFLKTLLFFNVLLFVIMGAFLVIPQAVYPPARREEGRSFTGLELLTGAGNFTHTLMYYGYYSNDTLKSSSNTNSCSSAAAQCESRFPSYNMPLAYFFTIGMSSFITIIILVYSMSKSFGQSFMLEKSPCILTRKAFCSWDFKVITEKSVKLLRENIRTQLKELLAEANQRQQKKTVLQKLWGLIICGIAWTVCIGGTFGCVLGIYYFSGYMHNKERLANLPSNSLSKEASLLALPVLVSFINLLMPLLFNAAAWFEEYDSPSRCTYVALSRNLILKVSVLGVLCYHWLTRVASKPDSEDSETTSDCWENFVGQELYRFLIIDFIFTLLGTFFGEFLGRLFSDKVLHRDRGPGFDIAKNVLDLIYGQTLAWLGILFAPLLPAVQIIKLLLLFYIKLTSVMMNCQAPRRPYRVSQMTTIFITLLCFPSFLGASVCVTYTMWSLKPSNSCGPFSQDRTMLQAGKRWITDLVKKNPKFSVLASAHSYLVENPFFLFVAAGVFLIVIYFHSQVVDGQRKIITLLQEHIENEGEDKKFLITRLQSLHEQKRIPAGRLRSQDSGC